MKSPAELFKILSVDKRIEIIELLKYSPQTVTVLAEKLKVTPSAMSQHLRVLKDSGLIMNERQGYFIQYSLNERALEEIRNRLNRICTCGCRAKAVKNTCKRQ